MATIYFDMDGTIADLYGVENWLDMLKNADATPYKIAKPLVRLCTLARMLNRLQKKGYKIGVISWLAKNSSDEYDSAVSATKREWLARHLPSVRWDEVNIVSYGYGKFNFAKDIEDILFDDESKNREEWTGKAFDATEIINTLKSL